MNLNSNIYSQDPLANSDSTHKEDNNSLHYEYVDLNQPSTSNDETKAEEVIYDVINTNNERAVGREDVHDDDDDSTMYATPKIVW